MKQAAATVISNIEVLPEIRLIWLEAADISAAAKPGQFVMVRCGEDTLLRRPISIHQVDQQYLALLVQAVGTGTSWLTQRQKGDTVDIFGPLGNGFTVNPDSKNILLVAGGMGIAPLRFLADTAMQQQKKVTLLMGASSACYLLPVTPVLPHNIPAKTSPWAIYPVTCTDDGSEGIKGRVTTLIKAYLADADQIFACGPVNMYRTMLQMPELKDKDSQLSLEIMMGCGTGVCYGCTIRTARGLRQVCKDGPVFNLRDLSPETLPAV